MSLPNHSFDEQLLKFPTLDLSDVASVLSWVEAHPTTSIEISSLVFEDSPRLGGEDEEHIRVLAEASDNLPPISVHRPTMRVIDGMHRVRAALLNGRGRIDARLLDCDEGAAFVLAVKTNVTHGLPLSQSDRAAAAARIIAIHPQWSDRAVAAATALSDKTISRIRGRSTAEAPQSNMRLGRDGRVRPLDSGQRREQAAAMIRDMPTAGLRTVARATGLSPATVRDVRQRLHSGEDPVPGRYRTAASTTVAPKVEPAVFLPSRSQTGRVKRRAVVVNRNMLLAKLSQDPSLRLSEAGRQTLRHLHQITVDGDSLTGLERGLPDHWAPVVADLARSCALAWSQLADRLQQRTD
ncbi:MAG: ParB/RepB/Spo0J family partition protein [Jatrophihabitantaceae bacterium]